VTASGLVREEIERGRAGGVVNRGRELRLVRLGFERPGLVVGPDLAGEASGRLCPDDPHALGDGLYGNLGLRLVFVSIVHVASPPAEDPPGRHP